MQGHAMRARHSSRLTLAAARYSVVLGVLLAVALICIGAEASSFVVRIAPGRSLDNVAAQYASRGYVVKRRNDKLRFLVIAKQPDNAESPDPAVGTPQEPVQATAGYPGSIGSSFPARQQQDGSPLLSPGGEEPGLTAGVAAAAPSTGQNAGPIPVPPQFSRSYWAAGQTSQQGDRSSGVSIASSDAQELQAIGGRDVAGVQLNPQARLLGALPLPAAQRRRMLWQQQRRQQQRPAASSQQTGSCPLSSAYPDKGAQFANVSELVPYGVEMVEAVEPEMVTVSMQSRSKVLYCVIDTGFDSSSAEFRRDSSFGCIADGTRANGTPYLCHYSYNVTAPNAIGQHGTHVSGTVVAARNGRGVVGVSAEGGLLYHFNVFGMEDKFDYADAILAWDDCIAELDYRKVATNTPDMKMVISMSFGSRGDVRVVADYLKKLAAQRRDILWLAAAGNDNNAVPNYPAASPEVVSVAAVDWNGNRAAFSNFGPTVEWAAPGVNTLSTLPLGSIGAFSTETSISLTPFIPPADVPDVLINPRFSIMGGSKLGSITAEMADCAFGDSSCANATGKICLMQRDTLLFCKKVTNCLAGGGIAALIYGRDDQPECEQVKAVTLVSDECVTPDGGWPIVMTASLKQGLFLKNTTSTQPSVTVTLDTGANDYVLGDKSGTSMATPTAAAVAGLVWSAHPECTAAQLRAAIGKTAEDRGATGRDDMYGYGIVKALQAHRYLAANPCPSSSDCVGSWSPWTACQGDLQSSTFVVTSPATGGGSACEAPDGTVRNRTCSAGVSALPDSVTAESGVWTNIDSIVSNDVGAIKKVMFTTIRTPNKGLMRMLRLPETSSKTAALPAGLTLQYLSWPGFVGSDTFKYSVSDAYGNRSTASVNVTVTPFTCRTASCLPGNTCTGTGCKCAPGSGLFSTWVTNSDPLDRKTLPQVPACRFQTFTPAAPLSVKGNQATAGTIVAIDYSVLSSARTQRCFRLSPSPVSGVTFVAQADAKCLGITNHLTGVRGVRAAASSCTGGIYSYAVRMPDTPGCYIMRVDMTDTQSTAINMLIRAR